MDEQTKEKIQKELTRQKYIKASAESKIIKLTSQLETGLRKHTKSRQKAGEKQSKSIPKTPENIENEKEEKSFLDAFNPFN